MTIDEIITLIQAVSDNGLTSFVYEEGDQKLILKKKKKKNVSQAPVAPVVISQPAAPVVSPVAVAVPTSETGLLTAAKPEPSNPDKEEERKKRKEREGRRKKGRKKEDRLPGLERWLCD